MKYLMIENRYKRARFYSELGVKSGDHLGLFAENSASYLISMYAANKINAVPGFGSHTESNKNYSRKSTFRV